MKVFAAGPGMRAKTIPITSCIFQDSGRPAPTVLSIIDYPQQADAISDNHDVCVGEDTGVVTGPKIPVDGVGDQAFTCGSTLFVITRGHGVVIDDGSPSLQHDVPTILERDRAIAEIIVPRIGAT